MIVQKNFPNFLVLFITFQIVCCDQFTSNNLLNLLGYGLTNVKNQISEQSELRELVSEKCSQHMKWFVENLNNATDDGMWALKMIDASAKIPAGLFKLNLGGWMGDFEECLEIKSVKRQIKGSYCLGTLYIDLDEAFGYSSVQVNQLKQKAQLFLEKKHTFQNQYPVASYPSFGICIPNGCTTMDLNQVVSHWNLTFPMPFECQTFEEANPPLTVKAWSVIAFFSIIVFLMVVSTVYDLASQRNFTGLHSLLIAFSVYTNGKKLLKVRTSSSELSCLNGIRVLSLIWVIAGHSFSVTATGPVSNALDILTYLDTTKSMIFVCAVHSVDSFLMITGMLVFYGYVKSQAAEVKFNIFQFYLHRYLRLTPPFLAAILVSMSLLQYLGSGPHWSFIVNYFQGFCEKSWWSALLYFQNYINVKQWCLGQTWYLNIDWQLYLVAPVFFFILSWKSKLGIALLGSSLLVFIVVPFYVTWHNELPALVSNIYGDIDGYQNLYYLKTHTRAAPWFVGALMGYYIGRLKFRHKTFKLSKFLVFTMWSVTLVTIVLATFLGNHNLRTKEYDKYGNAFYNSLLGPIWAACIGWIALACSFGYGGVINNFLSLPAFQVLNRFTYSIYLIHVTLLYMVIYASKTPAYFSIFNVAYSFWGITMLSLALSVFWVLAFESPTIAIEKSIRSMLGNSTEEDNSQRVN